MEAIEAISVALAAAALLGTCVYHVSVARETRRSRHETSRFPLFATRDTLLWVVLDGQMSEEDPAWRNLYQGVNALLGMQQRLHLLDCLVKYMARSAEIERNPALKARRDKMRQIEDKAAEEIPAFASARSQLLEAFAHLVRCRTTMWHKTALLMLVAGAYLAIVAMKAGLQVAIAVLGSLRDLRGHPSSDDIKMWGGGPQIPA